MPEKQGFEDLEEFLAQRLNVDEGSLADRKKDHWPECMEAIINWRDAAIKEALEKAAKISESWTDKQSHAIDPVSCGFAGNKIAEEIRTLFKELPNG